MQQRKQNSTVFLTSWKEFTAPDFCLFGIRKNNLKNIIVKILQNNFFNGCSNLTKLELPTSLTTINMGALSALDITSIFIPENVTKLNLDAFGYSKKLINIEVSPLNPMYFSQDGCVYVIDYSNSLYALAPALTEYIMPDNVGAVYGDGDVV